MLPSAQENLLSFWCYFLNTDFTFTSSFRFIQKQNGIYQVFLYIPWLLFHYQQPHQSSPLITVSESMLIYPSTVYTQFTLGEMHSVSMHTDICPSLLKFHNLCRVVTDLKFLCVMPIHFSFSQNSYALLLGLWFILSYSLLNSVNRIIFVACGCPVFSELFIDKAILSTLLLWLFFQWLLDFIEWFYL